MNKDKTEERKMVAPCYDHIGGKLGEAFFKFLIRKKWIKRNPKGREYDITNEGWKKLKAFGIDVEKLKASSRKMLSPCVERHGNVFYGHTGAYLGSLITECLFERGWIVQKEEKEYEVTIAGLKGLKALDINLK